MYGALYLTFAVAVVAVVAGFLRSQVATVFGSLAALLLLPMVALIEPLRPWLPSELLAAIGALLEGASAGDFRPGRDRHPGRHAGPAHPRSQALRAPRALINVTELRQHKNPYQAVSYYFEKFGVAALLKLH